MSASGPAAFRLAALTPAAFRGLVAIASSPGQIESLAFPADFPLLMINGTADQDFPIEDAREQCLALRRNELCAYLAEIDGGHNLFLSIAEDVVRCVKAFKIRVGK